MNEEMKNEFKSFIEEYLAENLEIHVKCERGGDIELKLTLGGKEISSAYDCVVIERCGYDE